METSIFLADGVEECEALLVVDLLRRAGIKIQTVAVSDREDSAATRTIVSSHDVPITCDVHLRDYRLGDEKVLVIPGGKTGVANLKASSKLGEILRAQQERGGHLAAVCAGPTVLGKLGLLDGLQATVYPGFQDELGDAIYRDVAVISDGKVLSGRALGASIDFCLELVKLLRDEPAAQEVAKSICYERN